MTIRKRNDDRGYERGSMGIDQKEGMSYTRDYAVDPWSYPGNINVPGDRDIKGRKVREHVSGGEAAYSPDADAEWLRPDRTDDYQFSAGSRQIWQDVEENQDPSVSEGHNRITAGVNRPCSEGTKDPRRRS